VSEQGGAPTGAEGAQAEAGAQGAEQQQHSQPAEYQQDPNAKYLTGRERPR
jgi:hypothetical protein